MSTHWYNRTGENGNNHFTQLGRLSYSCKINGITSLIHFEKQKTPQTAGLFLSKTIHKNKNLFGSS
jgi:hypothetical protein